MKTRHMAESTDSRRRVLVTEANGGDESGEAQFVDVTEELDKAAEWVRQADAVLIAAGAGMSVDAGIDYTNTTTFKQRHPVMAALGFRCNYELIGNHGLRPELQWGYLGRHAKWMRWEVLQAPVYQNLQRIVQDKEHFVITSNVDGMFERHGFDTERIYTVQGDFQYLQCLKPCSESSFWPSRPFIDRIIETYDEKTGMCAASAVPRCPTCGGPMMLNVRGGDWFLEKHYEPQANKFAAWLKDNAVKKRTLVIIEVGAGFNTPTVIRFRSERIVAYYPDGFFVRQRKHNKGDGGDKDGWARLVRINAQYAFVPDAILDRSARLPLGASAAMDGILHRVSGVKDGEASSADVQ